MTKKHAELLSPAGSYEKLKSAVLYGADAVYLAGKNFGMRAASDNFTRDELTAAVYYCHSHNVRLYVTVNVMPHTSEYEELADYIRFLDSIKVDAVIVSDIGVLMLVREIAPSLEIHISTQASAVSAQACTAWYKLGASRVVLARELTLEDIREIRANIPAELELEAFVHGAMCIAYSGRCLLSNYFTGRDANHGQCAQSCRWHYSPTAIDLAEEHREDIPCVASAEETPKGETFFMASKDTSMIRHIPELEASGISSYKIEGRVKSAYYTAVVTNTYRMALDEYRRDPEAYKFNEAWANELEGVSHREYGTGFYFTPPHEDANVVHELGYIREKAYIATAVEDSTDNGDGTFDVLFIQRNKVKAGDPVELISPGKCGRAFTADDLRDAGGEPIESAPHPSMLFRLRAPFKVYEGDILRLG